MKTNYDPVTDIYHVVNENVRKEGPLQAAILEINFHGHPISHSIFVFKIVVTNYK